MDKKNIELFKRVSKEHLSKVYELKCMWEKIKHLPYKRKEVRYSFLVETFKENKIMIYDENSFRKWGLRISGEVVFMKDEPFGILIDIIPAKEFLESIKKMKREGENIKEDLK